MQRFGYASRSCSRPLRLGRFRVGVVAGGENGHEWLRPHHLARCSVDQVDRGAGVVHGHALAGLFRLPHGRRQPPSPGPVGRVKPAVAVAAGGAPSDAPATAAASRPAA